eukprot:5601530-Pyramimonas_sp.AAC.1
MVKPQPLGVRLRRRGGIETEGNSRQMLGAWAETWLVLLRVHCPESPKFRLRSQDLEVARDCQPIAKKLCRIGVGGVLPRYPRRVLEGICHFCRCVEAFVVVCPPAIALIGGDEHARVEDRAMSVDADGV